MQTAVDFVDSLLPQYTEDIAWPDPVTWMQDHFYVYDTEDLLGLFDVQADPLREAMRRGDDGKFIYNTVLWSWMKKTAKSTIIAAVCDYVAVHQPKASITLIANDAKQAFSRVGYYMTENIKIGARKGYAYDPYGLQEDRRRTRITNSGYLIEYPNGSRVQMVAIDPRGEAGGNDDITVFSELWGWKHKSHQDMWAEMTISPNRFGYAQRWIDTYAGYEGESPILEQLYDELVVKGEQITVGSNPECYVRGGMFATWVTKHYLPWQTKEYYDNEERNLTKLQFKRIHWNAWVTSEDTFIPMAWWDDCETNDIPDLGQYEELVIALDAGVDSDCFAMVAVSRDKRRLSRLVPTADGAVMEAPDVLIRRYARQWTPPKDGKLKFWSKDPNEETPASELKRLIKGRNVVQVAYDPWQLEHFVSQLEAETGVWFEPFIQGGERELADKMLHDMIREKQLLHGGNDNDLRTHIGNANKKAMGDGRRLRIVKRNEALKIDLTVALSMACKRGVDHIAK